MLVYFEVFYLQARNYRIWSVFFCYTDVLCAPSENRLILYNITCLSHDSIMKLLQHTFSAPSSNAVCVKRPGPSTSNPLSFSYEISSFHQFSAFNAFSSEYPPNAWKRVARMVLTKEHLQPYLRFLWCTPIPFHTYYCLPQQQWHLLIFHYACLNRNN